MDIDLCDEVLPFLVGVDGAAPRISFVLPNQAQLAVVVMTLLDQVAAAEIAG